MMPPYRLAHLSPGQMMAIEGLENDLGLTLVAYEPEAAGVRDGTEAMSDAEDSLVLDALNDTYRTYDPHIF